MIRYAFNRFIMPAARDKSGAVAMIFAVLAAPIVILAGASVDYSTASATRTQIQAAIDAAALSGATVEPWSEDVCRARTEAVFSELTADLSRIGAPALTVLCGTSEVSASAQTEIETTLMSVAGIGHLAVGARAEISCQGAGGTGNGDLIGWDTGGLPDQTRVLTISQSFFGVTLYYMTPEGYPVIRLDNPLDEPTTITIRADPGEEHSYDVPHRGRFHVPVPMDPPSGEDVVFSLVEGPEPRSGGTATWNNAILFNYMPQGEPFYTEGEDEPRRCFIAS
ncbi:MAG: hypothetical protein JJU21_09415 [Salinarimonas sp.]|nr:hypothetical protein [Salinarimonas sp.]